MMSCCAVVQVPTCRCGGDICAPTAAARWHGHFPVVTQRPTPTVQPVWRTIEISQLQLAPGGRRPCCAGRASSSCAVVEVIAATSSCGMKLAQVL